MKYKNTLRNALSGRTGLKIYWEKKRISKMWAKIRRINKGL